MNQSEPASAPVGQDVVLSVTIGGGLRNAADDHTRLLEAVASFDAIEIGIADPSMVDTSTLQLVIAAEKSAARRGKTLSLTPAAAEALAACGRGLGFLGELPACGSPGVRYNAVETKLA
jgi:hypothetical protein